VLGDDFASGDGIDEVIWSNVGNTDAMIGAINSGSIDSIDGTLSISQAERATESSSVEQFTVENFAPLDTKLNFLVPIIRDKELRKALAHSIDNEGFCRERARRPSDRCRRTEPRLTAPFEVVQL